MVDSPRKGREMALFGTEEGDVMKELGDIVDNESATPNVVKEADPLAVFDEDALDSRSDALLFSATLTLGLTTLLIALKLDGYLPRKVPFALVLSPLAAASSFAAVHQFAKLLFTLRSGLFSKKDVSRRLTRAGSIIAGSCCVIFAVACLCDALDARRLVVGTFSASFAPLIALLAVAMARDALWLAQKLWCDPKRKGSGGAAGGGGSGGYSDGRGAFAPRRAPRRAHAHGDNSNFRAPREKPRGPAPQRVTRMLLLYPLAAFLALVLARLDGAIASSWTTVFVPFFAFVPLFVLGLLFRSGKSPFLGDFLRALFGLVFIAVPLLVFSIFLVTELDHPTRKRSHLATFSPLYGCCFFLFLGRFFLRFVIPVCCFKGSASFHNIE